jgi:hypothetical protein
VQPEQQATKRAGQSKGSKQQRELKLKSTISNKNQIESYVMCQQHFFTATYVFQIKI